MIILTISYSFGEKWSLVWFWKKNDQQDNFPFSWKQIIPKSPILWVYFLSHWALPRNINSPNLDDVWDGGPSRDISFYPPFCQLRSVKKSCRNIAQHYSSIAARIKNLFQRASEHNHVYIITWISHYFTRKKSLFLLYSNLFL